MDTENGKTGPDSSEREFDLDRISLSELYDIWGDPLYRYALMILADPAAAEDVLQQVFMKLLALKDRVNAIRCSRSYLKTAVRNECYNWLRNHQRKSVDLASVSPFLEAVTPSDNHQEERAQLEEALLTLNPDQREVIWLKVYEQMTLRQIADLLEISMNTVASRYRYALERLRHLVADREGG